MVLQIRGIGSSCPFTAPGDVRRSDCLRRYRGIEVLLALVLLVAATLKAYQLFVHTGAVIPGLLRSKLLLVGVIQAELLLASWLLIGGLPRLRFIAAVTCFSLFAMVASYEAFRAMPSCSCFGNVKIRPMTTAAFDALSVISLLVTRRPGQTPIPPSRRRILAGVLIVLLGSAVLWGAYARIPVPIGTAARSSAVADDSLVILEPQSWLNKPFALLDEINGSDSLRQGRWVVLFYHYDCDSCLQAIPIYQSLALTGGKDSPHVAFVGMPPAAPGGQDPVNDSPAYLHLSLRPDHDWFATTPVVAVLDEGRVIYAIDGEAAVHPPQNVSWGK